MSNAKAPRRSGKKADRVESAAEMLRTAATALWDAAALMDAEKFVQSTNIFSTPPEVG